MRGMAMLYLRFTCTPEEMWDWFGPYLIDEHEIQTPVAWLQDSGFNELIVGREVVFDEFDIEFKQAEEKIIFKKRNPLELS